MRTTTRFFIFVISWIFFFGGCVTVKLNTGGGERANGVVVREPRKPFTSADRPEVDAAWINKNNGNLISYLTDCNDPSDPPLNQIVGGALSGLAELKVNSDERVTVQGREGRRVYATGKVDGVLSEIDLLAFKRNHCIYILTYLGVQKSFNEDRDAFNAFISGFRAP